MYILCLLCNNGAEPCKYFSFARWYNVKLCQGNALEGHWRRKEFASLVPVCSSQQASMAPMAPGSCSAWRPVAHGTSPRARIPFNSRQSRAGVQHLPGPGFLRTPSGSFPQYLRTQIPRESYWHRTPSQLLCHLGSHSYTPSDRVWISALLGGIFLGLVAAPNIRYSSIL